MIKRVLLVFVLLGLLISFAIHSVSSQTVPTSNRTATVNGIKLHYVTAGTGDTVVLVPGWPETWYAWRKVIPILSQRYRVIAIDPRGIGESDRPQSGYDTQTAAKDVKGLIDQLGIKQIFLVGHDVGTWISYAYAAAYPQTVRRLVVLDAAIPGVTPAESFQLSTQSIPKTFQFYFHAVPDLPEELTAGRERQYLSWFFRTKAVRQNAIAPEDVNEYVRRYSAPGAMRAGFEYYRAVPADITQNQQSIKTKLSMPVLAIGGDQTKATGNGMLQTMQLAATTVRGGEMKGCGHYLAEECPTELSQQILSFFGEPNS